MFAVLLTTQLLLAFAAGEDAVDSVNDTCAPFRRVCEGFRVYNNCSFPITSSTDANGCTRCRCFDPCENHPCPEGQRCTVTTYIDEKSNRTVPQAQCKANAVDSVNDTCAPFRRVCEGFRVYNNCTFPITSSTEANGCTRCRCFDPCENHPCPEGQRCTVTTYIDEKSNRTVPQAQCKANAVDSVNDTCAPFRRVCEGFQVYNNCTFPITSSTDANGCTRCRCFDPCENHPCPEGQRCTVTTYIDEKSNRTVPQAQCKANAVDSVNDTCAPFRRVCEGFRVYNNCTFPITSSTDANGCTRCRCFDPCENHTCPEGQRCTVTTYIDEKSNRTVPQAQCKANAVDSVNDTCAPFRRVCDGFQVYNNCTFLVTSSIDANGCTRCRCFDACEDYPCPSGQRCTVTTYIDKRSNRRVPRAQCETVQ